MFKHCSNSVWQPCSTSGPTPSRKSSELSVDFLLFLWSPRQNHHAPPPLRTETEHQLQHHLTSVYASSGPQKPSPPGLTPIITVSHPPTWMGIPTEPQGCLKGDQVSWPRAFFTLSFIPNPNLKVILSAAIDHLAPGYPPPSCEHQKPFPVNTTAY